MGNQPSSTIDPSADTATRRDSTDSMSNQGSASAPSRAANARKGKLKPSTSVTRPSAQTSSTVSRVRNSVLRRLSPSASSTVNTLSGTRSAQNTMVEVTARSANTTDVSPSVTLALLPSEITNSETAWNRHSAAIEDAADVHHNGLDDDAPFIEIPASASAQENLQAHIDISTMTETGRSTVVTDAISESRLPNATNDADYTIPIRLDISIEDLLISSLIPVEEGAMALSLEDEFRIVGVNASELVRAELSNAEAEMRYTQTNRQNPVPSVDAFVAGHSLVQKSISLVGERRPVEDDLLFMVHLTSAAGVISLLDESDDQIKVFALRKLNSIVDVFWAEIADAVTKIEILYEDEGFKHRELAALVASKVYHHLGEYDESLTFALGAGSLFEPSLKSSEYVETIVSKCIDKYISLRGDAATATTIDPRLEAVVQRMFNVCHADGEFKQALGIALEAQRLDVIEETILKGNQGELLTWLMDASLSIISSLDFRNKVLNLLVKLYGNLAEPDYIACAICYFHLNDAIHAAALLQNLLSKDDYHVILAYQIAFDLEANATQEFLLNVIATLPPPSNTSTTLPLASLSVTSPPATTPASGGDAMETDETAPLLQPPASPLVVSTNLMPLDQVHKILSGSLSIKLHLDFLYRTNNTDLLILKQSRVALESRSAVFHSAITVANGFSNAGTTSDEFLRQNLEWLAKATNWTKFTATASLGVIHKGHISRGMAVLAPYLPRDGISGSPYSEGGSLFALGLIHANHGAEVVPFLSAALKNTTNEVIQHGACLGLGVAGMASGNESTYEDLKNVLFTDSAVAGEAAGLAMGLVNIGTANPRAIEEMLQYAHETQHEKIIRGLAVGISLIMYGKEEVADGLIEQLAADKDPILRYSGIYTVAMAYSGTSNNKAIARLLHVAVSDVNDDVRRAAVTALGFVLLRTPNQVPRIVQLLAESYNPHVRYGACLALGIACAGTAMNEALELLDPLTKDNVDFVRQGALMAMAMVLVQHNEVSGGGKSAVAVPAKPTAPVVAAKGGEKKDEEKERGFKVGETKDDGKGKEAASTPAPPATKDDKKKEEEQESTNWVEIVRKRFQSIIANKYEESMAIFGAVLGQGILDAGGRNVTISLRGPAGISARMSAVVGMAVFTNFWYWYPLSHFLSLAFTPTGVIGLDKDLNIPKFELVSNARPSLFAYPPATKVEEKKEIEKVATAVLSTTAKAHARKKNKEDTSMDADEKKPDSVAADLVSPMTVDSPDEKKKKKKEPSFEVIENMTRIVPTQLKYIKFKESSRYVPVKKTFTGGIVLLHNKKPDEPVELVAVSSLDDQPAASTTSANTAASTTAPTAVGSST